MRNGPGRCQGILLAVICVVLLAPRLAGAELPEFTDINGDVPRNFRGCPLQHGVPTSQGNFEVWWNDADDDAACEAIAGRCSDLEDYRDDSNYQDHGEHVIEDQALLVGLFLECVLAFFTDESLSGPYAFLDPRSSNFLAHSGMARIPVWMGGCRVDGEAETARSLCDADEHL